MGVFSTRDFVNESYSTVDLLDESIDITNAGNIEDGAMGMIIAETEANYTAMMKTIGICELAAIEQEGEAIYEASDVSGFFGKIKEFFKNILEKIKRLFKNFLVRFDSWTKSNKDFVTKYKKQLIAAKTKDLDFEGYKFTLPTNQSSIDESGISSTISNKASAASALVGAVADIDPEKIAETTLSAVESRGADGQKALSSDLDSIEDNYDDIIEGFRGTFTGDKSLTADEFNEELFKKFRDGESTKTTLEDSYINVTTLMSTLINYDKVKKETEKAYREIDKFFNKFTGKLDKAENKLLKKVPGEKDPTSGKTVAKEATSLAVRAISLTNRLVKDYQNCWTIYQNAHLRALKDEASQAKAICTKLLTRKPTKEGADLIGDDEGSYGVTHSDAFGNLKFI